MRRWVTLLSGLLTMISSVAHGAPAAPEHAALARLAGQWSVTQSLWSAPGAAATIDGGSATFEMILDGHQLRQSLHIAAPGKPFEGLGFIGYDTATQRFFSAWMDVNFTGIILATGAYDPAARSYTFTGAVPDPAHPGTAIPLREVMHLIGEDRFTYEYFETRGGKEMLAVRLEYQRRQ